MLELFQQARLKRFLSVASLLFSVVVSVPVAGAKQSGTLMEIMPISVDVQAPVVSRSITLTNGANQPMKMQARVFKWIQKNGKNYYLPTADVAVSPPMMTIRPRGKAVLRVLRVSRQPLRMQESYRIIIDQLPNLNQKKKGSNIEFVMSNNLPAFFAPAGDVEPRVQWRAVPVKGGYRVTATNSGNIYQLISSVKLLARGNVVGSKDGFINYALAGSTVNFFIPGRSGLKPDKIQVQEKNGTITEGNVQ